MDNLLTEASCDLKVIFCLLTEDDTDEIRQKRGERDPLVSAQLNLLSLLSSNSNRDKKKTRVRSCKKAKILQGVVNNGNLFTLSPKTSFWYSCYVLNGENLTNQGLILFRNRFQLPYHCFQELLQELKESGEFDR